MITLLAGCSVFAEEWSGAWMIEEAEVYLDDTERRMSVFRRSLVNVDNLYSVTRLNAYGPEVDIWERLREVNPVGRQLTSYDIDGIRVGDNVDLGDEAFALWNGRRPASLQEWRQLGRAVFFDYPLWEEPALWSTLSSRETMDAAGIQLAGDGSVPGVVLFERLEEPDAPGAGDDEEPEAGPAIGVTCALCHTAVRNGNTVQGAARRSLDLGLARMMHGSEIMEPLTDEELERLALWGPGRADILEQPDEEPSAIPDLWGLKHQSYLGQAGTLRHLGPIALAVRQETEMIVAAGQRRRPPRVLVAALALYLYGLEEPEAPVRAEDPDDVRRGSALFGQHCGFCHAATNGAGGPVHIARVGTNPGLGGGYERGTRTYRTSSLLRVLQSAPYFHDGSLAALDDLFNPARLMDTYTGGAREPGPVNGHIYGMDLSYEEQQALLAFLRSR
jgi:mono/diheme cytochrome c family protein